MSPRVASSPSAGRHWVRLRYSGEGEAPDRSEVGVNLLSSQWISTTDVYSFIAMPNRKEYEICFTKEQALQTFSQIFNNNTGSEFWKNWEMTTSAPQDVKSIVVKFWTGRIADSDVEQYLLRFGEILNPVDKPLDQFGIWYGVRRYKIKLKKNPDGSIFQIPNSISMGPYNGTITYPGQTKRCFICNDSDHQAKDCEKTKCWKCGSFGHKGKSCRNTQVCNLCNETGHIYFQCPNSYSYKLRMPKNQKDIDQNATQNAHNTETKTNDKEDNNWEENKLHTSEDDSTSGSDSSSTDTSDSEDSEDSESSAESLTPEGRRKTPEVPAGSSGASPPSLSSVERRQASEFPALSAVEVGETRIGSTPEGGLQAPEEPTCSEGETGATQIISTPAGSLQGREESSHPAGESGTTQTIADNTGDTADTPTLAKGKNTLDYPYKRQRRKRNSPGNVDNAKKVKE